MEIAYTSKMTLLTLFICLLVPIKKIKCETNSSDIQTVSTEKFDGTQGQDQTITPEPSIVTPETLTQGNSIPINKTWTPGPSIVTPETMTSQGDTLIVKNEARENITLTTVTNSTRVPKLEEHEMALVSNPIKNNSANWTGRAHGPGTASYDRRSLNKSFMRNAGTASEKEERKVSQGVVPSTAPTTPAKPSSSPPGSTDHPSPGPSKAPPAAPPGCITRKRVREDKKTVCWTMDEFNKKMATIRKEIIDKVTPCPPNLPCKEWSSCLYLWPTGFIDNELKVDMRVEEKYFKILHDGIDKSVRDTIRGFQKECYDIYGLIEPFQGASEGNSVEERRRKRRDANPNRIDVGLSNCRARILDIQECVGYGIYRVICNS